MCAIEDKKVFDRCFKQYSANYRRSMQNIDGVITAERWKIPNTFGPKKLIYTFYGPVTKSELSDKFKEYYGNSEIELFIGEDKSKLFDYAPINAGISGYVYLNGEEFVGFNAAPSINKKVRPTIDTIVSKE
jgi:hypothetical protein